MQRERDRPSYINDGDEPRNNCLGIMTGRHDLLHVDTNGRIDGRTDEFLFFRVDLFSRLLTIFIQEKVENPRPSASFLT